VERSGRAAADVIADAVKRIVADFAWPKSMRWGSGELRWVRPLHGIVAIFGEQIVPVEIDGIVSGATTVGHRFHHPGPITIGGAHDYAEKLRACHVIVDQNERERLIREGASAAAAEAGLTLLEDEGLVVENAGLTEWPVPLLGRFDPEFLDVPREVIVLTMRTNQKYFACIDEQGLLAPAFVCIATVSASDGGAAIVEGNRRVLAARLADARFFWEQDLKVPLEEQAKKLDGIVFHEKLGTVADKVERVAKLARWLAEEGIVKADPAQVERAARLAKADLVTGMVGEFPELQGVIGGYLAEAQGERKAVADAIRDHYKPVGQGDEVPTAPVTIAVALADKLDSLVGFFQFGERPTGSKDPFALRRAAIGILSLIIDHELRVSMRELIT
jgi:glycyl-tRNA synthetase beta chain